MTEPATVADTLQALAHWPEAPCDVLCYIRGHRQLFLDVREASDKLESRFYLYFHTVWFFEGPLNWEGVNFRLGTAGEIRSVLSRTPLIIPEERMSAFASQHYLFILEKPDYRVLILAGGVSKVTSALRVRIDEDKGT